MAKSIKGTKTEKNLLAAFAGESQARTRYTYFAATAKKEGYEQISAIFLETADNEREHAKVFFKHLEGGEVEITAPTRPASSATPPTTCERRRTAKSWSGRTLYPDFAQVARTRRASRDGRFLPRDRRGRGPSRSALPELLANVQSGQVF